MDTKRDVFRVKRALRKLLSRTGALMDEYGPEPLGGSKAQSEQKIILPNVEIKTATSVADALIESSGDHVFAFCKCITEPAVAMAPFTCIRGALEAGAIASWLMDPTIDRNGRLERSFAFRYSGLEQQRKLANSMGLHKKAEKINSRISEVENHAINIGFSKLTNDKGKRIGIGIVMPSITDLIGNMFDKESLYRLTSAIAHGHTWAIKTFSFTETDEKYVHTKELSFTSIIFLSVEIAHIFALTIWRKANLYGWDEDNFKVV